MGIKIVIYCTLFKKVEHVSQENNQQLEDMQLSGVKCWQRVFVGLCNEGVRKEAIFTFSIISRLRKRESNPS